jgi:hypothetical protein
LYILGARAFGQQPWITRRANAPNRRRASSSPGASDSTSVLLTAADAPYVSFDGKRVGTIWWHPSAGGASRI